MPPSSTEAAPGSASRRRRATVHLGGARSRPAVFAAPFGTLLLGTVLLGTGLLGIVLSPSAADAQLRRPAKAQITATAFDRTTYEPGETARLAVEITVDAGWHVQAHEPSFEYLIPTRLDLETGSGAVPGETRYPEPVLWQSGFEAEPLAVYDGTVVLVSSIQVRADAAPGAIPVEATLHYQACDDQVCLPPTTATASVELVVAAGGVASGDELFRRADAESAGAEGAAVGARSGGRALGGILVVALLGGLILNAMPCVLPVLSLKMLGLVEASGKGRRQVVAGALATSAGIVVSFWFLAVLAIVARSAGEAVGWGIQFQNPGFVAFLTAVMIFFSLNLWGLFEIPLPAALAGGHGAGLAGHFGAGLFATLMATPCSAPFLGTAVGFALSQDAATTLLTLTAVGVGMALPYLALAVAPGAARFLPRPGRWMETLKGFMGFLLAGTAIWLLYVLAAQIADHRVPLVQGALLTVGLFAWLRSRSASAFNRRLQSAGMAVAAVAAVALAATAEPAAADGVVTASKHQWVEFDEARAQQLAAEGRLVFVDVTADWCATCKVNERVVLEHDRVVAALEEHDVVMMRADWTRRDETIARYLERHGRYAIPFYVLYRPGQEPHVFGELLSRGGVVEVLEESAAVRTAEGP